MPATVHLHLLPLIVKLIAVQVLKMAPKRQERLSVGQSKPNQKIAASEINGTTHKFLSPHDREQRPQRDPCADDEKIALLIQNREFLRYLRQDPHFQRAVVSKHQASARYAQHYPLPSGPALPMLLASSRPSRSPNTGRLFSRPGSQKHLERPQPVPDGPVIEERKKHEELAIPEGPLIGECWRLIL